jgi:hypothetical protein
VTRALVAAAAVAASLAAPLAVPAVAAPETPVKLVHEPGSCPANYYDIGWVGVEGARWRICERKPLLERPL